MSDTEDGPWEGGQDEPGQWLPGAELGSPVPMSSRPIKPRKRREYSANGPLTKAMRACLDVMARWGGPMTENAIRELVAIGSGLGMTRVTLLGLEARGMVDNYRWDRLKDYPKGVSFMVGHRGLWIITPAGIKEATK